MERIKRIGSALYPPNQQHPRSYLSSINDIVSVFSQTALFVLPDLVQSSSIGYGVQGTVFSLSNGAETLAFIGQ